MLRNSTILVVLVTFASVAAHADLAVEFGNGPEKLTAIDFSGELTPRQQVVRDFFTADGRDLDNDFLCYEGLLRSIETRVDRGYGIDCLGIAPVISARLTGLPRGDEHGTPGGPVMGDALSPQIDAVTFFFLPGGHLVADGLTTVRPIFDDVGDGLDSDGDPGPFGRITHITGSIPGNDSNVVDGSGRFQNYVGSARVRLSGAVNTDDFFLADGNPMSFSCYFSVVTGSGDDDESDDESDDGPRQRRYKRR